MKSISATIYVHGYHKWADAPKNRLYLKYPHRHLFVITAHVPVAHSDRETEFHDLQDELKDAIPGTKEISGAYDFEERSCEHIGEAILEKIPQITKVEVSEDGECAAIVERGSDASSSKDRPYIVTLCGSTKFRKEYEMAAYILEQCGIAVLSVGGFMHAHNLKIDVEMKIAYDRLHLDKIRMSDGIVVLNRNGYVGKSTLNEMIFAHEHDKDIFLLEDKCLPEEVSSFDMLNVNRIHPKAKDYDNYWIGKDQFPFIIRNSVMEFAKSMEIKLSKTDYRGGWKTTAASGLFNRLIEETEELNLALNPPYGESHVLDIMDESTDVGNYAMMIFDNAREDVWK